MNGQPTALFDATVIIDALANGDSPTPDSIAALQLAAKGEVEGYMCAAAIECLNDMLTHAQGHPRAREKILELRHLLSIASVDAAVINAAMELGWQYLDDALTHACARVNGLDAVVTLNADDFADTAVPVLTPTEFLKKFGRKS